MTFLILTLASFGLALKLTVDKLAGNRWSLLFLWFKLVFVKVVFEKLKAESKVSGGRTKSLFTFFRSPINLKLKFYLNAVILLGVPFNRVPSIFNVSLHHCCDVLGQWLLSVSLRCSLPRLPLQIVFIVLLVHSASQFCSQTTWE